MFSAYANIRTNCLFSYDAGGIAKCVCDSYYNIQIKFKGNYAPDEHYEIFLYTFCLSVGKIDLLDTLFRRVSINTVMTAIKHYIRSVSHDLHNLMGLDLILLCDMLFLGASNCIWVN